MKVHFTGFAALPQTITALGNVLIWLCLALVLLFVVAKLTHPFNSSPERRIQVHDKGSTRLCSTNNVYIVDRHREGEPFEVTFGRQAIKHKVKVNFRTKWFTLATANEAAFVPFVAQLQAFGKRLAKIRAYPDFVVFELRGGLSQVLDQQPMRGLLHQLLWRLNDFRINPSSFTVDHRVNLLLNGLQSSQSSPNAAHSNDDQEHCWEVCGTKKATEVAVRFAGGCYCRIFGCMFIYGDRPGQSLRLRLRRIAGPALVGLGLAAFLFPPYYTGDCENKSNPPPFLNLSHSDNTVPHKYLLTSTNYWGTVIGIGRTSMPNVLSTDKQVPEIGALAEGSGFARLSVLKAFTAARLPLLAVRAAIVQEFRNNEAEA